MAEQGKGAGVLLWSVYDGATMTRFDSGTFYFESYWELVPRCYAQLVYLRSRWTGPRQYMTVDGLWNGVNSCHLEHLNPG